MFSFLLILFVVVGFGLSLFIIVLLLLNPKKYQNADNDPTIVIMKIVESHRESLPLNSAHGWSLVSSKCSLRCWKKELSFNLIGSPVILYACSKEINCAAVILLNVIADISTWPEWDIQAQDQTVHLELPENPSLHADAYMQCDQLVLTTSMLKAKPEIEMFRFGNLESNGTGWILLWNAKQLDWILYIAQPIDNCSDNDDETTEEEKCMLTAMWGCEAKQPLKVDMPDILCQKVLNLSEAISWSQLKVRPFQSLLLSSSLNNPHFPTIHSALNDLPRKPCVLLEHEKKGQPSSFQKRLLAVVPLSSQKPVTTKNITKFSLILCPLKKAYKSNSVNGEPILSEEKRRSRKRLKVRSDSMTSSFPRIKHLEIENRRSSSLSAPVRKKLPELTVTQPEEDAKPPQRAASHSFLDVLFQRRHSSEGSNKRSPSHSRNSSPGPEFRKAFPFEKTSSLSSQEDLSNQSFNQDLDVSDASEGETNFLKTAHNLQNESMDFKALGEYSISTVLQENLRTSLIDIDATEDDQKRVSGGWIYKETNKDVSVFKKMTSFDSCVVMSYLCKGVIASPQNIVWKTLCNPLTRFMYDDTAKRITVLHEYPHGQKLIHMCNESVTLLRKEVQDFCILQTEKREGSKFILGFHSVKNNACPPVKDVIRGTVIASGWVVEPMKDNGNSCQVSYLVQMIVSSPEISAMEEISNIQSQCIYNLSLYLSTKPAFVQGK